MEIQDSSGFFPKYKKRNENRNSLEQAVEANGGDKWRQRHNDHHERHDCDPPAVHPDDTEEHVPLFARKGIQVREGHHLQVLRIVVIGQGRQLLEREVGDTVREEDDAVQEEVEDQGQE